MNSPTELFPSGFEKYQTLFEVYSTLQRTCKKRGESSLLISVGRWKTNSLKNFTGHLSLPVANAFGLNDHL